jgi:hypothetical protein
MRIFLMIILLIAGLIAGGYYYLQNKITYLPDWYTDTSVSVNSPAKLPAGNVTQHVRDELVSGKKVSLPPDELSGMIRDAVEKRTGKPAETVFHALRSEVSGENVVIEAVINPAEIDLSMVPGAARTQAEGMMQMLLGDGSHELYIRFSGKPKVVDGRVIPDETATIQIGDVTFSVQEISRQFTDYERILGKSLPLSGLSVENGRVILQPSKR